MNYTKITVNNSEWIEELNDIDVGVCIECCYSCEYRKLRNPLYKNKPISCGQLREKFGPSSQCQDFKHYELQRDID